MTNLIAKVAELRELEGRRQAIIERERETPNHALIERLVIERSMTTTFVELLNVLDKIQAGDSEVFDTLIDYLESNHGGTEYEDAELSVMRRYADLAHLMEDKE